MFTSRRILNEIIDVLHYLINLLIGQVLVRLTELGPDTDCNMGIRISTTWMAVRRWEFPNQFVTRFLYVGPDFLGILWSQLTTVL